MSKIIFVTGTSSGLGKSIVIKLAAQGHRVYASMRDLAKKDQLEAALKNQGLSANIIQCDFIFYKCFYIYK